MVIIISGSYIKELRKKLGISQKELSERVGVTQAHIAKIESEKVDARLSTINRIVTVLESSQSKTQCKNFMTRHIISISPNDKVSKAIHLMRRHGVSQIPVIQNDISVGSIKESTIIRNLDKNLSEKKVKDIMEDSFPIISSNDTIEVVKSLLDFHQAVIITEKSKPVGIMTKSNLMNSIK
ncbi:CBS domain-containing protein [archaeon]|nr:CBS domain-containing protein [archaeon]